MLFTPIGAKEELLEKVINLGIITFKWGSGGMADTTDLKSVAQ
jgi:hypothetical protein